VVDVSNSFGVSVVFLRHCAMWVYAWFVYTGDTFGVSTFVVGLLLLISKSNKTYS